MKKKVHPSPPPAHKDAVSVLKILPVAIASLSAALLPEEQEVLAYLIACSCSCPSSLPMHHKTTKAKTKSKTKARCKNSSTTTQIVTIHRPVFACRCFECYMSFWSRWDASPNRDLIHKAIDLFDDHITTTNTNTFSLSHSQKQVPVPSANNGRKTSCNTVKGEEGVTVGFNKEEGKSKCLSVSPANSCDNHHHHHHRNGMAARGFMSRMFPNIMGFVAEHLWTVWSPPV